ncbi:MAG TPA: V-type ATP synthase subunit F [Candidatus Dormibacteraeota bacterium]|nr:V-type ATP synthase subunit F [Candidatus Dormibacteraeota bacterium]
MGRIGALGDRHRIQGFAMAGVESFAADTEQDVAAAWQSLPSDLAVLILTPQAATVLADRLHERRDLLVAVLP